MTHNPLTIRRASAADTPSLARLAALDSATSLTGDVLLAEIGGEPWAALEVDTGATIADPFRPSADLVELLRLHAKRMSRELGRPTRRLRPLARAA